MQIELFLRVRVELQTVELIQGFNFSYSTPKIAIISWSRKVHPWHPRDDSHTGNTSHLD